MEKLCFLFGGLALAHFSGSAQSYSIDSYKIAGGGGTSTGENLSLVSTIGQSDAGKLSGGTYILEGGFLSGFFLVQTPGAPVLSIHYSAGTAIISWATEGSNGFFFQEAPHLNPPGSWINSGITVNTASGINSVTVPATGMKYYRLFRP